MTDKKNLDRKNPISRVRLSEFDASSGLDRGASKLKEGCWYMIKMIFFLSAFPFPSRLKAFLLKCFGAKIGRNVVFKPRINIQFPWKLEVGDNSWLGEEVLILNFEKIKIGANVCVSQRAFLCGGNHDYSKPSMPYRNGPIMLNDGCWVGACSFIAPDVTIGIDSVISAGSIVTTNIPPNLIFSSYPKDFSKARWTNS